MENVPFEEKKLFGGRGLKTKLSKPPSINGLFKGKICSGGRVLLPKKSETPSKMDFLKKKVI